MKKLNLNNLYIKKLYLEDSKSAMEIAKLLNCSEGTIQKRLKEENVLSRKLSECHISRKNNFNENYFETINCEEKAYWLGFLYADGCVRKSKNTHCNTYSYKIQFALAEIEPLLKFKNSIESNHIINKYLTKEGFVSYRLTIYSNKMFNDLNNLGCVERKTSILTFPNKNQVPQYLINHFIRGYFDGDGSVYILNPKNYNNTNTIYKTIGISILGTKEFITELNNHLLYKSTINKENRSNANVYYIRTSGTNKVYNFYNYLYNNATIFLERKKLKFNNYYKKDVQRL